MRAKMQSTHVGESVTATAVGGASFPCTVPCASLSNLPIELLACVCEHVGDAATIAGLGLVCRAFRAIVADEILWRTLCLRIDPDLMTLWTDESRKCKHGYDWLYRVYTTAPPCDARSTTGAKCRQGTVCYKEDGVTLAYHGVLSDGLPHGFGIMRVLTEAQWTRYVRRLAAQPVDHPPRADAEVCNMQTDGEHDVGGSRDRGDDDDDNDGHGGLDRESGLDIACGMGKRLCEGDRFEGEWVRGALVEGRAALGVNRDLHYCGEVRDGCPSGHGAVRHVNGDLYKGQWLQGKMHGQGTLVWARDDGARCHYVGEWRRDLMHGHGVEMIGMDQLYEGAFYEGERRGHGTCTYATGLVYQGQWHRHLWHGQGKEHLPDGATYEGDYVHGRRQGWGRFVLVDGTFYEGEWLDGQCHGIGTRTYVDGGHYEGRWVGGRRHGHGKYVHADSACAYKGDWFDGAPHGHGVMRYADGGRYEGEWLQGKRHGHGRQCFDDGDSYKGDWFDDRRHGRGTYWHHTGWTYEGEWRRGRHHGAGTLVYQNGDRCKAGPFRDRHYDHDPVVFAPTNVEKACKRDDDGDDAEIVAHGTRFKGKWRRGVRHGRGSLWFVDGARFRGRWKRGRVRRGLLLTPDGHRRRCTVDRKGRVEIKDPHADNRKDGGEVVATIGYRLLEAPIAAALGRH